MMNKKFGFALAAFMAAGSAHAVPTVDVASALSAVQRIAAANMINWQIGDFHKFAIETESFGAIGSGRKEVTAEDTAQNALWYVQTMDVMGQQQKVETLLSRADGKVLKTIVNGQEQSPDQGEGGGMEIIEQSETSITVPAGTFDCMYVKAKVTQNGQTQELEAWVNPMAVNLDGILKIVLQSQMGPVSLTLQEFGPRH